MRRESKCYALEKEKSHEKQTEEGFYNIMEIARKL